MSDHLCPACEVGRCQPVTFDDGYEGRRCPHCAEEWVDMEQAKRNEVLWKRLTP